MTRRRRAAVLLGLALLLGTLSATHMARREAALRAQLGPVADVVVARDDLAAGHTLELSDLGVRTLPARYAPPGEPVFAAALAGHKLAVAVPNGGAVSAELLQQRPQAPESAIARGQRAVDVVATGSPQAVVAGAHVDVLVTTERRDRTSGATRVALEDVEVLAARAPAQAEDAEKGRVDATLRVTAAQAVYLAAAQSFARDVRLLTRAPGDRRKIGALAVDDGL
ncbi:RcpC/CpaB family pilus assembly protein [Solirubrobacter ginsenosidimutans]|uniref:RcpC/CpaB family pilus assembly protein n=1 Tax=Solirubrobacter ginsenosidimutans TaxID=490573 RepID=A0A9X3S3Q2_9ACTN|nr:RcpC/CpaB family pilus assembly protein [Solirubrobacter ginsenosidimutans]MDA0164864.1 RcpC/CpaB family pilus assembly protein [Solirubrobacter ginsenosidimutans]